MKRDRAANDPFRTARSGHWTPPLELVGTSFERRRSFFESNPSHCNGCVPCPACGYPTLGSIAGYDYCPICHWTDDGHDDPWADQPNGGPNDSSLAVARANFAETYSVWAFSEANDFGAEQQDRLFSPGALAFKRRLCALYDGLQYLRSAEAVARRWRAIEAQWARVRHDG
ncbi:MAG TPA: CPCC family cysteine-rich protein [Rubrivivax sp.]|nr:CPCC family cysteine-rich protein [Rubrivivax sp.]